MNRPVRGMERLRAMCSCPGCMCKQHDLVLLQFKGWGDGRWGVEEVFQRVGHQMILLDNLVMPRREGFNGVSSAGTCGFIPSGASSP